jgi:2-methylcitrate dehydratase PrpD
MFQLDRRSFVRALTLTGLVSSAEASSLVTSSEANSKSVAAPPQGDALPPAKGVTRSLANYVVSARTEDLPESVRKEATRTMLNWVGCAVGGSRHDTVARQAG